MSNKVYGSTDFTDKATPLANTDKVLIADSADGMKVKNAAIQLFEDWLDAFLTKENITGLKLSDNPSFSQVTSTVATGTAPLVVSSKTETSNLRSELSSKNVLKLRDDANAIEDSTTRVFIPFYNSVSGTNYGSSNAGIGFMIQRFTDITNSSYIGTTQFWTKQTTEAEFYIRKVTAINNVWSSWFKIWHSGNINLSTVDLNAKKVIAAESVQFGNDSDAASVSNVGAIRYRADANNSYCEMVMQTGAASYAWVIIQQNTW